MELFLFVAAASTKVETEAPKAYLHPFLSVHLLSIGTGSVLSTSDRMVPCPQFFYLIVVPYQYIDIACFPSPPLLPQPIFSLFSYINSKQKTEQCSMVEHDAQSC